MRLREKMLPQQTFTFGFSVLAATWYEHFQKLESFYMIYGHCNVPFSTPSENDSSINFDHASLNTWCKHQRRQYKRFLELGSEFSSLTEEQIEALNSVNFSAA
jgi:hypothetical protein